MPSDVDAFVGDAEAGAYERLVDHLLASPHFGEKWARQWLDLARYADSDGYEQDWLRKYAYNYRDWVIRAINSDLPLDRFTIEQIAGDLLPKTTREEKIATGFHCQTVLNREPGTDAEEFRCKEVVDRVNTTATTWLGLTVGCAECHAHKHDPISQKEYYQLYALFNNSDAVDIPFETEEELAAIRQSLTQWNQKSNELARAIVAAGQQASPELHRQLETHIQNKPVLPRPNKLSVLVEHQKDDRRATYVHIRGDFLQKGARVEPGALRSLHPFKPRKQPADRLDFAYWLIDRKNPLTARVMVNQIWAQFFGRGLVSTMDDFGTHGSRPTHPELLDWLAVELQKQGWSRKEIIRLIVTSATYRQSSNLREELMEKDPENNLLARQNRFRLSAEEIRDSQLACSGLLEFRIGGPSFRPPVPADVAAVAFGFDGPKQKWDPDPPRDQDRRSLYILLQRTLPDPMLTTFDAPDALVSCARRERSNNPLQALTLLNQSLFFECSRALAAPHETCVSAREQIRRMFTRCLARPPTAEEEDRLIDFYQQHRNSEKANAAALTLVARALLNLDEFIVRE
jgi:hypothetical protein